ncbi:hypothetical protein PMAYCL1PPCAC_22210, partial [Pristionchus mayeri]
PMTLILDDNNNITFYDLNRLQRENGEKGYFEIPEGTEQFVINNPWVNGVTRPLALWAVQNSAPFLDTLEVYDAADGATIE